MATGASPPDYRHSPLWAFALTFWQHPGIETASLDLQAKGWSVSRILCACWQAAEGRPYSGDEPEHLGQWRATMTERIRDLRKSVRKDDESLTALRQHLARAELEAEKTELHLAWQWLSDVQTCQDPARSLEELALSNLKAAAPESAGTDHEAERSRLKFVAAQMSDIQRQYLDKTRNRETV